MSEAAAPSSRQTLRRCIRSVQDLLTSEARWRAITLAALLVGFLLAINGLNVVNSYVARDFMTAIAGRDMPGFTRQALLYLAVFAASTAPPSTSSASGRSCSGPAGSTRSGTGRPSCRSKSSNW
jgi:putative ATP-binding cassette transporter